MPSPEPIAQGTPAVSEKEYAVAKGDTLSRIARAHGMKVAQLREINGLKNDNLKIGQKLKVSGEPKKEAAATTVAISTPAPAPSVKAEAKAPAPAAASYTVSKGDTLAKIARQFNTTPTVLMAANKITDPTKLKIGAVLVIPGSASRNQLSEQKDGQQPFKPVKPDHGDLVMVKP
jgi:LysM repeat protein